MVGFLPRSPGNSVPAPGRTSSCEELAAGFTTSPAIEAATVGTAKGMVDGSLCDIPNKLLSSTPRTSKRTSSRVATGQ